MRNKSLSRKEDRSKTTNLTEHTKYIKSIFSLALSMTQTPLLQQQEDFEYDNNCQNCIDLKTITETPSNTPGKHTALTNEQLEWELLSNAAKLCHDRLSLALLSKYLSKNNSFSSCLGDFLLNVISSNNLPLFVGNMQFIWQGFYNKLYGENVINSIYNTTNRTIFAYFFSNAENINKILSKFPFRPEIKSENYFYYRLTNDIKNNGVMNSIWSDLKHHNTHNLRLYVGILRLLMLQLKINKFKILQDNDYDNKKFMFMVANTEERWLLLHQLIITIQGKLPGPYISILHETFVEYLNEELINEIENEIKQQKNKIRLIIEEVFKDTFDCRTFLNNFEMYYDDINFWKPLISIIWSVIFGTGFYTRSGLFKERDTLKRQRNFRAIMEHKHYYNPELPYFLLCNQDNIVGIAKGTRHLSQLFDNNSLECIQLNLSKFDNLSESFYCVDSPLVELLPDLEIIGKNKKTFNLSDVDKMTKLSEDGYKKKVIELERYNRRKYKLKQSSKLFKGKRQTTMIEELVFDESSLRSTTQLRKYLLTMQIVEGLMDPLNEPKNFLYNKIIKTTKCTKWQELVQYYTDCEMDERSKLELFSFHLKVFENDLKRNQNWMLIKDGYQFYKEKQMNTDLFEFIKDGRLRLNGPRYKALEKHMHPFDIMLKYCRVKRSKDSTKTCKVHKDVHSTEKWKREARLAFEKFAVECLLIKTLEIMDTFKINYEKRLAIWESNLKENESNSKVYLKDNVSNHDSEENNLEDIIKDIKLEVDDGII